LKEVFAMNSTDMAQKNICFYSNKCEWSKAFIKEIAGTPLKGTFTYICIDKDQNGRRPNLPEWLKKVPTLVIKGDPEPIKTDAEVMNWLYTEKMKISGPGGSGGGGPVASLEPEAWMNNEMSSGLKDAYSFIDDKSGGFLSRSFDLLSGPGTRTGSEIPGGGGGSSEQKTKKEQLFDSQMEAYMKSRESGMPQQRPRM
jgi:hypothetical protein